MTCPHHMHIQGTVTVGSKGQVVIPKAARDALNINEGDQLMVLIKGDMAIWLIKADDLERTLEYMQQEVKESKKS